MGARIIMVLAMAADERSKVCPACNAQVGKPCTAPTDTGRREVRWYHYARQRAVTATTREYEYEYPDDVRITVGTVALALIGLAIGYTAIGLERLWELVRRWRRLSEVGRWAGVR